MNWLAVIKAGRECLTQADDGEDNTSIQNGDIFGGKKEEEKKITLTPLEAAALAAIIRETCAQLHILSLGSSVLNSSNLSAGEKLLEVIQDTELELRKDASFRTLLSSAQDEARKMKEAQVLEAIAVRNKERLANLRAKLEGNERIKQRELHKKQEAIAQLKDQILELVAKRDVSLSYVERSEVSRREQNLLRCEHSEKQVRSNVTYLNEKTTSEFRVHEAITSFLQIAVKNLEDEIETWVKFHENELIRRNNKLKLLRLKIADEKIKVMELTSLYMEHQKEMNDYLEYKEQKRIEAEHDQFIYDTATKIQAWWRGTMVRRGLGPYKKRKKPPKDKKKKK